LNGKININVTDNGPGIPDQYRKKVFEKFFRVPMQDKHNVKGYGLGLTYAAQVMEQHKGAISVVNIPEGGCTFTVSL
jgi:signal transduction histidine kinase